MARTKEGKVVGKEIGEITREAITQGSIGYLKDFDYYLSEGGSNQCFE